MEEIKVGSEIFGVWIKQGRYHSSEAMDEMGWGMRRKRITTIQNIKYNQ